MGYFDKCIEAAQKLAGLSAAAIFSLVSVALFYILYKKDREAMESNEKWRLTREGQIRAEEAQTIVQGKLVDITAMNTNAVNALSSKIDVLYTIIKERIPKKGDNEDV